MLVYVIPQQIIVFYALQGAQVLLLKLKLKFATRLVYLMLDIFIANFIKNKHCYMNSYFQ